MKRTLRIEKTTPYVWRKQIMWPAWYAHIPCWWVVDAEDNAVQGGYSSGHNQQSGYSFVERRKDAKAFIDGYDAVQSGVKITMLKYGADTFADRDICPHSFNNTRDVPYIPKRNQQESAWWNGAVQAYFDMDAEADGPRRTRFPKFDKTQE